MRKALRSALSSQYISAKPVFEDSLSSPIVLQRKTENQGWLLWISPAPECRIPKSLRSELPPVILDCIKQLRLVRMFEDTALYNMQALFRGVYPTLSVFSYYEELEDIEETEVETPAGYQLPECLSVWKSLGFPHPCLIDGVSFFYDRVEYVQTLVAPLINTSHFPMNESAFKISMSYFFSAALRYNQIACELYSHDFLLYEGWLVEPIFSWDRLGALKDLTTVVL